MEKFVLHSPVFEQLGIQHGFFTKRDPNGGKNLLNAAFGRADPDAVIHKNRKKIAQTLGEDVRLVMTNQGHTNWVRFVAAKDPEPSNDAEVPVCDALVTASPHVALGIYTADCVPILLVDPCASVVGVAHGGWKGLYQRILAQTISCMQAHGARPENIAAAIGPCIRAESYSVDKEFLTYFKDFPDCLIESEGAQYVDLPGIARRQLEQLGVQTVDDLGVNTYADPERFYSYRRAIEANRSLEGAQASVIALI